MEAIRNVAIAAMACVLALAGCGGGSSGSGCGLFSEAIQCLDLRPLPPPPAVSLSPLRQTTQVGMFVTFTASAANVSNPTYAWCRSQGGTGPCVPLPEAMEATLTLASANLGDDGAWYRVTVTGREGTATSSFSRLAVSSMPGVVYEDGEFLESEWTVTPVVVPAQGGPAFNAVREATGGHPGAYRRASYDLPTTRPGSVRILYVSQVAIYYPTSQGAVHVIDFAEDCITTSISFGPAIYPLIEQGGRRYIASGSPRGCGNWSTATHSSLARVEFVRVDGPACGAGEACPDFSGAAPPIRLGLVGAAELEFALPPTGPANANFAHGFDNWKATVWRK